MAYKGVSFLQLYIYIWCRTDCHSLSGLSRVLEIIVQGKMALVEIIGDGVRIAWNLVGLSKMALWAIVVASPRLVPLDFGEFLRLAPENYDFAIYNNFCFLNNFLLKSQNMVLLVLGWLLRSVVYDSTFNSIFSFWVNFGVLSPNRVISAN